MPNRKEPRLEIEEQQPTVTPTDKVAPPKSAYQASEPAPSKPESSKPEPSRPAPSKPTAAQFATEVASSNQAVKVKAAGSSGKAWLAIFLALCALGLFTWQFMQFQQANLTVLNQQKTMQLLASRVQDLEVRLSETGEDLSVAGSSFNEKLEWADSEIRKLRVIAHQRNRPAIEALEIKSKQLEQSINKTEKLLAEALGASKKASASNEVVLEKTNELTKNLKEQTEELNSQIKGLSQRLTEVTLAASTFDQRLRDQNLRGKVTDLEKQLTQLAAKKEDKALPDGLQAKITEQQEILASLEASRGQLVSRVTRLMEEVRELQQAH